MMESKKHLFVVGGNGVLGKATAEYFLQQGHPVTVLVRNRDKALELEEQGARVVTGDITNPEDMKHVFDGADVVLAAVHSLTGRGKNKSRNVDDIGHKRLIDEAMKSGVGQFIFTSVNNVAQNHPIDFYQTKYHIEQYLKMSGLNYTIIRLPAFMEWHAFNFLGKDILEKGKVTILGKGNNPLNFIAVRDVVAALGKIIGDRKYYNLTLTLSGPGNYSKNEVAERFGKAINIKPRVNHLAPGALKLMSVLLQPIHPGVARVIKYSLYTDKSDEKLDEKLSVARFGVKPTTLDEFISTVTAK